MKRPSEILNDPDIILSALTVIVAFTVFVCLFAL